MINKMTSTLGLALLALASVQPATAQSVNAGQQFYQKICAKCHEAGIGPVITGRGLPAITYVSIARNGNRAMPAFRVTDMATVPCRPSASPTSTTRRCSSWPTTWQAPRSRTLEENRHEQ